MLVSGDVCGPGLWLCLRCESSVALICCHLSPGGRPAIERKSSAAVGATGPASLPSSPAPGLTQAQAGCLSLTVPSLAQSMSTGHVGIPSPAPLTGEQGVQAQCFTPVMDVLLLADWGSLRWEVFSTVLSLGGEY